LKSWRFASNSAYSSESILALGCASKIGCFGYFSAGSGLLGPASWSSSNPRPLPPGIGPAFDCSGAFARGQSGWAGRSWIAQQLREAFPETCPYHYAILDRDGKFGEGVTDFLIDSGMKPRRISPASPWQNGVAERWIGRCRRELLDHVIVFNEAHLRGLLRDHISYYHADRIHDSLEKDAPAKRPVSSKPSQSAWLVSSPRIGGLHHRYDWQKAACRGLAVDAKPIAFRANQCLMLLRTPKVALFTTSLPGLPALQNPGNVSTASSQNRAIDFWRRSTARALRAQGL
jgi:hypothetical protein